MAFKEKNPVRSKILINKWKNLSTRIPLHLSRI